MDKRYLVEYVYDGKIKQRAFTDFHRLHIFIDRCILDNVLILKVFERSMLNV